MILTEQERNNGLWVKIKADLETRLASLRSENDKDMNETATAKLRGRIAETRRMLDIGVVKPKIEIE